MTAVEKSVHRRRTGDPVLIVANGNPLSRRASGMGQAARRQLKQTLQTDVELVTTQYAGHAREVAERWASEHLDGTIIGIGGDGTLNEIGNGVLAASVASGSRVVLVVCAGGNANDQYRSWPPSRKIQLDDVLSADPIPVDVLEVSHRSGEQHEAKRKYALSYVAIGTLATGASVVNHRRRGIGTNLALIPQTLLRAAPVSVTVEGRRQRIDSLSWHVVATMAKVFRVSSNARRTDGLMEVVVVRHRRLPAAVRMSWFGLRALVWPARQSQSETMAFHWEQGGKAQLDGENIDIPPGSDVTVRCVPGAVRMLCCDIDASIATKS